MKKTKAMIAILEMIAVECLNIAICVACIDMMTQLSLNALEKIYWILFTVALFIIGNIFVLYINIRRKKFKKNRLYGQAPPVPPPMRRPIPPKPRK